MKNFSQRYSAVFPLFLAQLGTGYVHFPPFPLRPEHKVVQFGLYTKMNDRGTTGLRNPVRPQAGHKLFVSFEKNS